MEPLLWIGTVSFTISGYLLGVKKRFDLLGIVILALLTAIGGGIIRDLLLNRLPRIFLDASPLAAIGITLVLAWVLRLQERQGGWSIRLFIIADSIGLSAFSIAGAAAGLQLGINAFGVIFTGFVTAIGGGMLRDVLVNDVPFILHRDVYGTVSLLVAAAMYGLYRFDAVSPVSTGILFLAGLSLRLIAHYRELRLPQP